MEPKIVYMSWTGGDWVGAGVVPAAVPCPARMDQGAPYSEDWA